MSAADENSLDNLLAGFSKIKLSDTDSPAVGKTRAVLGELQPSVTNKVSEDPAVVEAPVLVKPTFIEETEKLSETEAEAENLTTNSELVSNPADSSVVADLSTPADSRVVTDQPGSSVVTDQADSVVTDQAGSSVVTDQADSVVTDQADSVVTDPFERVRELDEEERWRDRNEVITAPEHKDNIQLVRDILNGIIDKLPTTADGEEAHTDIEKSDRCQQVPSDTTTSAKPEVVLPVLPAVSLPDEDTILDPLAADTNADSNAAVDIIYTPAADTETAPVSDIAVSPSTDYSEEINPTIDSLIQDNTPAAVEETADSVFVAGLLQKPATGTEEQCHSTPQVVPASAVSSKPLIGDVASPRLSLSVFDSDGSKSTDILNTSFRQLCSSGGVVTDSSTEIPYSTSGVEEVSIAGLDKLLTGLEIGENTTPSVQTETQLSESTAVQNLDEPVAESAAESTDESEVESAAETEDKPKEQAVPVTEKLDEFCETLVNSEPTEPVVNSPCGEIASVYCDQELPVPPPGVSEEVNTDIVQSKKSELLSVDIAKEEVTIQPATATDPTVTEPPTESALNQTFEAEPSKLNCTFDSPGNQDIPATEVEQTEPESTKEARNVLNHTFDATETEPVSQLNQTFDSTEPQHQPTAALDSTFDLGSANSKDPLNETFDINNPEAGKLDSTFDIGNTETETVKTSPSVLNTTFDKSDTTSELNKTVDLTDRTLSDITSDYTAENQTVVENQLNSTFDKTVVTDQVEVTTDSSDITAIAADQTLHSEETVENKEVCAAEPLQEETTAIATIVEKQSDTSPLETAAVPELSAEDQPIKTKFSSAPPVLSDKMGDEEEIPIPRGAYTINWDELDEFAGPFAMSKPKALANSPPIRSNGEPPRFDPTPEPPAEPAIDSGTVSNPPDLTITSQPPDITNNTEASNEPAEPAVADPPKKKTPVKKKKVAGKAGGPSKFAAFRKQAAAKAGSEGAGGDAPDLCISIPKAADDTSVASTTENNDATEEPLPPPAAYPNFEECDDPFGSKSKSIPLSPPIRAQAPPPDFENVADPFGTKSKVQLSPPIKARTTEDFEEVADPFNTSSKMALSPVTTEPPSDFSDPFSSKSKVPNSPPAQNAGDEDIDPFKTQSKVPQSPTNTDLTTEDPFKSKSKMTNSPTAENAPDLSLDIDPFKPRSNKMANSPPQSPSMSSAAKVTTPNSPFMSAAELSSPVALKGPGLPGAAPRVDSPGGGRGDHSTCTTTSVDDEFVDAVDELPKDEFKPAHPDMFNTTADFGVLDRAARMNPSFKESALARQSLYRKFDPLVDAASPHGTPQLDTLSEVQDKSMCLLGNTILEDTPKNAKNKKSGAVDRLLDITISSPAHGKHGPLKFTQDEMDEAHKLVQQMKLDYEAQLLAKDREWDRKLEGTRSELRNEQEMNSQNQKKMRLYEDNMAQFEKTVNDLLNEKEKSANVSEEQLGQIKAERDQYAEDLHQIDTSFSDLHKRYDKLRTNFQHVRQNETRLRQQLEERVTEIKSSYTEFESLKTECQDKLAEAHSEIDRSKSEHHNEITKVQMALRKSELNISSLQQQLAQKAAENEELTKICDNLIQLKGSDGS